MSTEDTRNDREGMSLRTAAVVAGCAYLLNPVSYAEFSIDPKLIIPGHIEQTVQNISANAGLFVTAILCYLASFIGDVVLAWSLPHSVRGRCGRRCCCCCMSFAMAGRSVSCCLGSISCCWAA